MKNYFEFSRYCKWDIFKVQGSKVTGENIDKIIGMRMMYSYTVCWKTHPILSERYRPMSFRKKKDGKEEVKKRKCERKGKKEERR
jgi:hypothetical protein